MNDKSISTGVRRIWEGLLCNGKRVFLYEECNEENKENPVFKSITDGIREIQYTPSDGRVCVEVRFVNIEVFDRGEIINLFENDLKVSLSSNEYASVILTGTIKNRELAKYILQREGIL